MSMFSSSYYLGPGPAKSNPSPQERDNMFLMHMATIMDGAVKKWQCCLCGKMAKLKGDILDHVECKHMSTAFMYNCKYCPMEVNTNRKLRLHEVCNCHSMHDQTEQLYPVGNGVKNKLPKKLLLLLYTYLIFIP